MLSRTIRRTHLYLALFLTPWMVGYALSTILMTHHKVPPLRFSVERTLTYDTVFSADMAPRQIAAQILADLDLSGAFNLAPTAADGTLVITRDRVTTPYRVTFAPAERRVTVERADAEPRGFLSRLHRRHGFKRQAADMAMALIVDLVVVALLFWVLSGLWLWWEMRTTRTLGAVCVLIGIAFFGWLVWTV